VRYVVTVAGERIVVNVEASEVIIDGERTCAELAAVPSTPIRVVTIGDVVHEVVERRRYARGRYTLWLDGFTFEVEALDERTRAIHDLAGNRGTAAGPAPLIAPMPGLVVRVNVQPGDQVSPGQGLVIIEAMKMENELRAQAAGRVKAVPVAPGTVVEKGALLVELE
jgi:biotin carboxyl carrier protein